jgi:prepilin-type N-terminal cleavage/methylation domain-containing protein
MRRRQGFTLVEMLVAMALTMFIMVILSNAFATGLEVFGQMKAIGDMQDNLRTATTVIREDLAADHFQGKARLSDPTLYLAEGRPTSGFVRIISSGKLPFLVDEGADPDGVASSRAIGDVLHMSVKRRGNRRENFFFASIGDLGSPLRNQALIPKTTFFDQPADARFQDDVEIIIDPKTNAVIGTANRTYNSQWAEVAYLLARTGSTVERTNPASVLGTPLHTLYRIERVVVPDNTHLNWPGNIAGAPVQGTTARKAQPAYAQMSVRENVVTPNADPALEVTQLYFNSPADLTDPAKRSVDPTNPSTFGYGVTQLLGNVVSFQVRVIRYIPASVAQTNAPGIPAAYDSDPVGVTFDSATSDTAGAIGADVRQSYVRAIVVTLRIWDTKTQQTRQVTLVQDM